MNLWLGLIIDGVIRSTAHEVSLFALFCALKRLRMCHHCLLFQRFKVLAEYVQCLLVAIRILAQALLELLIFENLFFCRLILHEVLKIPDILRTVYGVLLNCFSQAVFDEIHHKVAQIHFLVSLLLRHHLVLTLIEVAQEFWTIFSEYFHRLFQMLDY